MSVSGYSDRMVAAIGAVGAAGLIGYLLLAGLTVPFRIYADDPLVLIRPVFPVPPAPAPPPPERKKKARPTKERASAPARKDTGAPVVAPRILPVLPSPMPVATMADTGAGIATGASDRPGPGHGAGGTADGAGGGGDGEGGDTPPRQIKGKLNFDDMPSALRLAGIERLAAVRYKVNIDGRVSECAVVTSTGSPQFDDIVCRLIEKRFRFQPSRDEDGNAVPSIMEEQHRWRLNPVKSGRDDSP